MMTTALNLTPVINKVAVTNKPLQTKQVMPKAPGSNTSGDVVEISSFGQQALANINIPGPWLPPPPTGSGFFAAGLIHQMGDDDFETREEATRAAQDWLRGDAQRFKDQVEQERGPIPEGDIGRRLSEGTARQAEVNRRLENESALYRSLYDATMNSNDPEVKTRARIALSSRNVYTTFSTRFR